MRLRSTVLLGLAAFGLGALAFAGWPMLESAVVRSAEHRLRQETGQDWRIRGADLDFRPSPRVTLRDLAVGTEGGGDAFGARIREIRLMDPWSALFGSGASVQAVVEGLDLRLPLTAATAQRPLALDGIKAIRADLGDAKLDLTEAGRVLTASAEKIDLGVDLADKPGTTAIKASFDLPAYKAALTAELNAASGGTPTGPVRLTLEPRSKPGYRVEAGANATLQPAALRLDGLAGTIDGEPFSGSLSVDYAAKPRFTADLGLEALTLTAEGAPPQVVDGAQGLVIPVDLDVIPIPAWFEGYEAQVGLRLARLNLGKVPLGKVALKAEIRQGGLDAALAGAAAYDGNARARYVLGPEPDGIGRHQLSLSLSRIRVLPLLTDVAAARGIDGIGTLRLDLQAKGASVEALRRSLGGSADLSIVNGQLNGLDLAGTIGLLPQGLQGLAPGGHALATRLDLLSGSFVIADGQAVTNDLQIKTAVIQATGIGSIDLFAGTLDVHLKPQLANAGSARPGGKGGRLDVPIRVSGPWSNPSVSADVSGLVNNPAGAIETLKELGAGILGREGDRSGGALGGEFGENLGGLLDAIIPRQDRSPPQRRRP